MNTYVIRRRSNWKDARELEIAAARSTKVGNEEMPDKGRWVCSYVVNEDDGRLGTVCIYQGTDRAAIHEHAKRAGMTADDIIQVEATVVVRDDPAEASKAA
jgi:hypothetical protein